MGMYEPDAFDWKEMLPHSRGEPDKDRLRKSCASFANSAGGFLIFGVKDSRSLAVDDRLAGINAADELPRDFGNFPALCYPPVEWRPLQPAIALPNGRVIHVIEIPKSW